MEIGIIQMNPKYEDANKIINKHISSILGGITVVLFPVLLYAGGAWVDERIDAKMGDYATKAEIVVIQKQISNSQIDRIQEDIFTIKDRRIDGLTSNSDEKKLIRLENKIQKIEKDMKHF